MKARPWRTALALTAAALLHWALCEWRSVEYPAQNRATAEARLLLPLRHVDHPVGNSAEWDAQMQMLRGYHAAWMECWRKHAGPEEAACLQSVDGSQNVTVQAVHLRECEEARSGGRSLRSAALAQCLESRGQKRRALPMWTRDDFGLRFDGPYAMTLGLFAEAWTGSVERDRALAIGLGIAAPAALLAFALWSALPMCSKRRRDQNS